MNQSKFQFDQSVELPHGLGYQPIRIGYNGAPRILRGTIQDAITWAQEWLQFNGGHSMRIFEHTPEGLKLVRTIQRELHVSPLSSRLFELNQNVYWDHMGAANERLIDGKTLEVYGSIRPESGNGYVGARNYGPVNRMTKHFRTPAEAKDYVLEYAIEKLTKG